MNTKHKNLFRKGVSTLILLCFLSGQVFSPSIVSAQSVLNLPMPGAMVGISPSYVPIAIKGLKVYPDNPFRFDFILDTGNSRLEGQKLQNETNLLIKYFLAALTVPDDDQWVNLSPYEKDRVIPKEFGVTEMGRDLLAQDYLLKQLTASLIYPEHELGKKFWDRVNQKAYEKYGDTKVPMSTFNKVWIMPDHAKVYESGSVAFITESHLKVMLESDYVALATQQMSSPHALSGDPLLKMDSRFRGNDKGEQTNALGSQILREIVLPEIEKEINEGKNFTKLRQIYHSMIMAAWFKRKLQGGMLSKIYVGANKVAGVDVEDKDVKQKIYDQYIVAFKRGVYNYIKEEIDPVTQENTPRKYFSGGVVAGKAVAYTTVIEIASSPQQLNTVVASSTTGNLITAFSTLEPTSASSSLDDKRIKRMLELSKSKDSWDWVSDEWEISELIYSPGGIQKSGIIGSNRQPIATDEFGNRPHWVYILYNSQTDKTVYVGPDDVKALFGKRDRLETIDQLRAEKEAEIKANSARVKIIAALRQLFGETEGTKQLVSELAGDIEKPGDRHIELIESSEQEYEEIWKNFQLPDVALQRFLEIFYDVSKAAKEAKRWEKLIYLSVDDQKQVSKVLAGIKDGKTLTIEDIRLLIKVHKVILDLKNSLKKEALVWARRGTQKSDEHVNPRRPAYQANIWVASWLAAASLTHPLILDVGANSSVLWSTLKGFSPELADDVVDLEYDKDIYEVAPNPLKIRADISRLTDGIESSDETTKELITTPHSFDILTVNFVLDQLEPADVRGALIAFEHLLKLASDHPRLIISMPKGSPLKGSRFHAVLQRLGYKTIVEGANLSNQLTTAAKERISQETGGNEYLRTIEATLTEKVFHVGVYEKTRDVAASEFDQIDLSDLEIRNGDSRQSNGNGNGNGFDYRFTPDTVDLNDLFASLKPEDFLTKSVEIVTLNELSTNPQYAAFYKNLDVLLWLKDMITNRPQVLEAIPQLRTLKRSWESAARAKASMDEGAAFIQADFVRDIMWAMDRTILVLDQVAAMSPDVFEHLTRQREEVKTAWDFDNRFNVDFDQARQAFIRNLEKQKYSLENIYDIYQIIYAEALGLVAALEQPKAVVENKPYQKPANPKFLNEALGIKSYADPKIEEQIKQTAARLKEQNGRMGTVSEIAKAMDVDVLLLNMHLKFFYRNDTQYVASLNNLGMEPDDIPSNKMARRKLVSETAIRILEKYGYLPTPKMVERVLGLRNGTLNRWRTKGGMLEEQEDWGTLGLFAYYDRTDFDYHTIPIESRLAAVRYLANIIRTDPNPKPLIKLFFDYYHIPLHSAARLMKSLFEDGYTLDALGIDPKFYNHAEYFKPQNAAYTLRIFHNKDYPVDKREQAIKTIIGNLENRGIKPTYSAVLKEMNLDIPNFLKFIAPILPAGDSYYVKFGIENGSVPTGYDEAAYQRLEKTVSALNSQNIPLTWPNVKKWVFEHYPATELHDGWLPGPIRHDETAKRKDALGIADGEQIPIASSSLSQAEISPATKTRMENNLGGIDMNSKALDLQTEGEGIKFDMPFDPTQLQNIKIEGFTPVILRILPTNLPLLRDLKENKKEIEVSSL